ncbi:hypothetical protein AB1Y20_023225 [Prymnesium parvum]|uniref:Glutathione gamma-glutamylcysteinyltransferase n=1 Tax=Prymnesium parvum TaxID=97485 RepID=A0AB34JFR0_PRYPA
MACLYAPLMLATPAPPPAALGNEYGPGAIAQIKQATRAMARAVDFRDCSPRPQQQIGPSCHTSSHSLVAEIALCLSDDARRVRDLSLTDFWSCKEHYGFQHGIEVVNTWNQQGAFSESQHAGLAWSARKAEACEKAWKQGKGAKQTAAWSGCDCQRVADTKNPAGYVDPARAAVQPGFLDRSTQIQHCALRTEDGASAWRNEVKLAKLVAAYGPVTVMSHVQGFGFGSPTHPVHRCVRHGSGGGHNYVVAGYNLTDNPHTAYWIVSDSIRPVGGWSYLRMFVHCPSPTYWPAAMGIADVVASRYCIAGDRRGACGGAASCAVLGEANVTALTPRQYDEYVEAKFGDVRYLPDEDELYA